MTNLKPFLFSFMDYFKKFLLVFGLFLLSQVSVSLFTFLRGYSVATGHSHLSTIASWVLMVLTILNIWLVVFLAKKFNFEGFSFSFDFLTKKNILIIFIGLLTFYVINIVGNILLFNIGEQTTQNEEILTKTFIGQNPILIILFLGFAAPIMEEIVFRGGIIGFALKDKPFLAIFFSSFIFGALHLTSNLPSFFIYFTLGLVLAYIYYKTQCLEITITIHFINNFVAALLLVLGS